jgi:hypothetical protein
MPYRRQCHVLCPDGAVQGTKVKELTEVILYRNIIDCCGVGVGMSLYAKWLEKSRFDCRTRVEQSRAG